MSQRTLRQPPAPRQRQEGAVLFIGMITLLVLTIIGLHASRASQMTMIAATNTQESAVALALAEISADEGERALLALFGTAAPPDLSADQADGYYATGGLDLDVLDWDSQVGVERVFDASGELMAEFVVEYLGEGLGPGTSLAAGAASSISHIYRVTGRGLGARGTVRIVQTIFSTQN